MERLTMIDGCGNHELARCMDCGLEKAGENLENCGMCEEGWQRALRKLAAYEELMERWKLRSIEEADRIFQRVNALGGTDLMAQYRAIGSIDHIRDLIKAEQEGRLVVLPCKAGSLIYVGIKPAIITRFFGYVRERYFHAVFCDENKGIDIPFEELGKTVFLTREEAEAALAVKGSEG